jgi:hypothetical protein
VAFPTAIDLADIQNIPGYIVAGRIGSSADAKPFGVPVAASMLY